jgi:hypothetical protein
MQYTPPVAPYETPRRQRRHRPLLLVFILPPLLFALLFFGGSYLVSPDPDIKVQPGVGSAQISGRDVVLVPYERHGPRGMFQLLTQDMFQVRLAAADAGTGEVLWDTQLSDELIWEASVLAAGSSYAYVATDSGLKIIDLRDGSVTVDGLGSSFFTARSAYGYDAEARQIMALDNQGAILAIRLDSLSAAPAEPMKAATWAKTLSADRSSTPSTPAGDLRLRQQALGSSLIRVGPAKEEIPVGNTVFQHASLVQGASRYALIRHTSGDATVLSAVSLETGAVTGSVHVTTVDRAIALPDGTTAVPAGNTLALVGTDGRITSLSVGSIDLFGNPS